MTARPAPVIPLPPPLLGLAGIFLAFCVGALLARGPAQGVGVLIALAYAPLVFLNLPLAIAAFMALMFIAYLPVVSVGPTAATLLILAAWAGVMVERRGRGSNPLAALPLLLPAVVGLWGWLVLSGLWAEDLTTHAAETWHWFAAIALLLVVASVIQTRRQVETVLLGFVGGAVLSIALGLIENGLAGTSSIYDTATSTEGRLQGGSGDPNYLAAGIVPAIAFALALFRTRRNPLLRLALLIALLILALGLAATQSRGGLLAAVVALGVAIVVVRRGRAGLIACVCLVAAFGAAWFAANPAALARVTSTDQGGNGRSELWTVAWRMALDKPATGVGLNNFRARSGDYVQDVGTLRFAEFLVERPHVVHNSYLQMLAENGIVGLGLLLAAIAMALAAMRRATARFRASGDRDGVLLADAVFVAACGMLAACFFLSAGHDKRLWFILGLGVALLGISARR